MFHFVASLFVIIVVISNNACLGLGWNPSNFSFNPDENYDLVFADEFEDVGPAKAIINGKAAYAPNPKNWALDIGSHFNAGIQNYTNSI